MDTVAILAMKDKYPGNHWLINGLLAARDQRDAKDFEHYSKLIEQDLRREQCSLGTIESLGMSRFKTLNGYQVVPCRHIKLSDTCALVSRDPNSCLGGFDAHLYDYKGNLVKTINL